VKGPGRLVLATLAALALALVALACAPPEPGASPSGTPGVNPLPTLRNTGGPPDPTILVPPPIY
jgi:hypothetical protein